MERRGQASLRRDWLCRLADTWLADLNRCLEEPGVEEVHRARTGTRRLEAHLEALLGPTSGSSAKASPQSDSSAKELVKAAESWMRQMKKIRRAAGTVRDLDVHRGLLESYTGVGKAGRKLHEAGEQSDLERSTPIPETKSLLEEQALVLDRWLGKKRDRYSVQFQKEIKKRLPKIEKRGKLFLEHYQQRKTSSRSRSHPADAARTAFARLVEQMPQLNAENLHDFRKGAKKARYLTESNSPDAKAKRVGKWIKKIQDSIGIWHDWLVLSQEAAIALKDREAELVGQLEEQVAGSYREAQETVERLKPRLLTLGQKPSARKKPAPAR